MTTTEELGSLRDVAPQAGVPASVGTAAMFLGLIVFPIGLPLAWGLYKRRTWAWHVATGVIALVIFLFAAMAAGTGHESFPLAPPVLLAYFVAFIAYAGVMWRTRDAHKWRAWSLGFLVFAALAAATMLFGRSQTVSGLGAFGAGAFVVVVAVVVINLYVSVRCSHLPIPS